MFFAQVFNHISVTKDKEVLFALNMMDFTINMMDFIIKTMDFVLKVMCFMRQFLIRASFIEIYNEEVRDLLGKDPEKKVRLFHFLLKNLHFLIVDLHFLINDFHFPFNGLHSSPIVSPFSHFCDRSECDIHASD